MRERTEEEILAKSPIKIKLGDVDYDVVPLPILKQREWRTNLNQEMASIIANFNPAADNRTMVNGLTAAMLQFPDKLIKMVFAYAPNLPEEQVMKDATEEQMANAFTCIMTLAFPFLAQLKLVTQIARAQLSQ